MRTLLIALLVATAALAAAPMDQEEQRHGFAALSDGKTFDGWKHPGNWEIQDGAFARVRPSGQLTYEVRTMPDDFELRFDWKVSKGCNSGVYYRPGQVEYQVLDDIDSPYGETHARRPPRCFSAWLQASGSRVPWANGILLVSVAKGRSSSIGSTSRTSFRSIIRIKNGPRKSAY